MILKLPECIDFMQYKERISEQILREGLKALLEPVIPASNLIRNQTSPWYDVNSNWKKIVKEMSGRRGLSLFTDEVVE